MKELLYETPCMWKVREIQSVQPDVNSKVNFDLIHCNEYTLYTCTGLLFQSMM